jgi:hypothetical protein
MHERRRRQCRLRVWWAGALLTWVGVFAGAGGITLAQSNGRPGQVDVPLCIYDELRAASRAKPEIPLQPYASARLVDASLAVDLAHHRASWQATIQAESGGATPPPVPLLAEAPSLAVSSVSPDTAAIDSKSGEVVLVPERPGTWKVHLEGQVDGIGEDSSRGIRFSVPKLSTLPAAFDFSAPDGSTVSGEGAVVELSPGSHARGRITVTDEKGAVLIVRGERHEPTGPPVVTGRVQTVVRLAPDHVRSEIHLILRVRHGALEQRTLLLPGVTLLSVDGPALATGPDSKGAISLRFEPPVEEPHDVTIDLAVLEKRDPQAALFQPRIPHLEETAQDQIEQTLAIVADGSLLLEPRDEKDWLPRASAPEAGTPVDAVVLSYQARIERPHRPAFEVRSLTPVAVPSALARVSIEVFVGEEGQTRTRLVASVRTRGRSSLGFRLPEDSALLAVRVDDAPVAASRPRPDHVDVPVGGKGEARIELLVEGRGTPPRAGDRLVLTAPSPEDPVERVSWRVVLPPFLGVKEEGKRLPALTAASQTSPAASGLKSSGDRALVEFSRQLALRDRLAGEETAWSAHTDLPEAPAAYEGDFENLATGVEPLALQVVARKGKERWF